MVSHGGVLPWDRGHAYVIAEAGVNHNGNIEEALALVEVAAQAGADAVKFQAFKADELVQPAAEKAKYQRERTGAGEDQLQMLRRCELSASDFRRLAEAASNLGLDFICTPFDRESAEMLRSLPLAAIKVASGDITYHSMLRQLAAQGRPMIVSTGMASLGEIEEALAVIRQAGAPPVALLHCTSSYPAADEEVNLRVMETLRSAFHLPVGFSDHTLGTEIACAAVALGAVIIEKHFTLDKSLPGPDHAMSLDPKELRSLLAGVRRVEKALGTALKRVTPGEEDVRRVARRSICAACDIRAGEEIREEMLAYKRPGVGITPNLIELVVGRVARRAIRSGERLSWADLESL